MRSTRLASLVLSVFASEMPASYKNVLNNNDKCCTMKKSRYLNKIRKDAGKYVR